MQTTALSNLKIDKVTVWDSGSGEKGGSTAQFMSSLVKSFPPLQDIAGMVGVELPEYLGKINSSPLDVTTKIDDTPAKGTYHEKN
jgi:flotillin